METPPWVTAIGLAASAVLVATLAGQIYTQWRTGSARGVSPWLFSGQIATSIGLVAYSVLGRNPIFIATNALVLCTALIGQYIDRRNRARGSRALDTRRGER